VIREHEFNTRWWGSPVGILDDPAFFDLDPSAQDEACASYAWVEYSAQLDAAPGPDRLGRAGFYCVDTQIRFRINLSNVDSTRSIGRLSATSAVESPFEISIDELKSFEHERFRFLPGITAELINGRYALWSTLLIANHPAWCLKISDGADVQGWFLAQAYPGKPLNLTLAMLKFDAHISGHLLYQRAMLEFAARGARIGDAAFSVANTPVMNIYAALGARFLPPKGYWLRWSPRSVGAED
jgi:hypothetical protein